MEKIRSLLLLKLETSGYGVDSTPTNTLNALFVVGEPSLEFVTSPKERSASTATFGKIAPTIVKEGYKLSFQVELKGVTGNPASPPPIGVLLKIAGFTETIEDEQGSESCTYDLSSDLETPSATAYFWIGGTKHVMLGCVANLKFNFSAGEVISVDAELTGLLVSNPSDVTFPTPTFNSNLPQIWQSGAFKLNAITSLIVSKFNIDMGNEIVKRPSGSAVNGINRYYVKDRNVKVDFDPEKVALSTFDPYTLHTAQTECDLQTIINDGTPGQEIEINVNNVTLDAPKTGNRDNVITYELSGQARVTPIVGNTELQIIFR